MMSTTTAAEDDNYRRKRGRRTTEDSVVDIRYSSYSSESVEEHQDTASQKTANYLSEDNSSCKPAERKLSLLQEILLLLEEQRDFREELEEVHKTNFNLDRRLSNCSLKVEDFNRKLLLVEYELSDFKRSDMKWEKKADELEAMHYPLRRSNRSRCNEPEEDEQLFDDGRHKLEKYAKIHGIVDVEIEMYNSSANPTEDEEEEDEDKGKEERVTTDNNHRLSEDTFSFEDPNKSQSPVDNSQYVDERKVELGEEEMTARQLNDSRPQSKTSGSAPTEYSLVDADDDIFSQSINTTDTIEQIEIVLRTDKEAFEDLTKGDSNERIATTATLCPGVQEDAGLLGSNWLSDVLEQYELHAETNQVVQEKEGRSEERDEGKERKKGNDDDIGEEIGEKKSGIEEELIDEDTMRIKKENEEVDRLLKDLDITKQDVERATMINVPSIRIQTGVEDGAPTLREHKDDISEDRTPSENLTDCNINDRNSTSSTYGFEDSDDEKRQKRKNRPLPRRFARGFFARLCACWHN